MDAVGDMLPTRYKERENDDENAERESDGAKGEKCATTGRLRIETGVIVGVEVLTVGKTLVTEPPDDQADDENPVFGLDHITVGRRCAESPNDPKLSGPQPESAHVPAAARGEGAACALADAVTEPVGPQPRAETERQGCGSLQRMVRRSGDSEGGIE